MAEPMTNEEMDARIAADTARREEAARIAQQYLQSRNMNYTPANMSVPGQPPPSPEVAGPPPPPAPPPAPSDWKERAKQGAKQGMAQTAGMLLGGPVGAAVAGNLTSPSTPDGPPEKAAAPKDGHEESGGGGGDGGPSINDTPLIIPGMGQPRMVLPAGMYPSSESTSVHVGRPVPEEAKRAFNASTYYAIEGGEQEARANRQYYEQMKNLTALRLKANSDAAEQHAKVQAERDAMAKQKLAEIEAFNSEASAKIDPFKSWKDRGALGSAMGIIAVTLGDLKTIYGGGENTQLRMLESAMNREMEAQVKNSQLAGQRADRARTLYGLHLERLGDKDKAADATRLALLDNVNAITDQIAAEKGVDMSNANLMKLKAGIAESRGELLNKMQLQELNDINKQATSTRHNPVYAGGGMGAKLPDAGPTILIPPSKATERMGAKPGESIRVSVKEPTEAARLQKEAAIVGRLVDINNKAIVARETVKKAFKYPSWQNAEAASDAKAELKRLEQEKSKLISSRDAQGVLKEAEYFRTMELEVGLTDVPIAGDVRARLQKENEHMTDGLDKSVKAAGGSVVVHRFVKEPNGVFRKVELETTQLYDPDAIPPVHSRQVK